MVFGCGGQEIKRIMANFDEEGGVSGIWEDTVGVGGVVRRRELTELWKCGNNSKRRVQKR